MRKRGVAPSDGTFDTVVLISPLPPPYGGIARWTRTMFELSVEQVGARLELVNTGHGNQRTDETPTVVRVATGIAQIMSVIQQLLRIIARAGRPACVHINTSGSMGLIRDVLVLLGCRAWRQHTVLHIRFGRTPEVLESRSVERVLLRSALRLAGSAISIDERTHAAVNEVIGSRAQLIPNFIQAERYEPLPGNRSKTVLFLGSVGRSKGIDELIQAWQLVKPVGWTLRLIGPISPSYQDPAWRNSLDRSVEFLGAMDHEPAIQELSQAAVLVLPSHTEGFPNVVLEAMATGTPVIATNVGAVPAMLAGDAGEVVPARDAKALANALRRILNDEGLRDAMAEHALERVHTRYSTSVVMKQYRSVWRVRQPQIDEP